MSLHVEEGLSYIQGRGVQGKEQNSRTSIGVTLHKPKQNVRAPKRYGSKKMVSYVLVVVRGGLETYEEAKASHRGYG